MKRFAFGLFGLVFISTLLTLLETATPEFEIPMVPDLSINGVRVPKLEIVGSQSAQTVRTKFNVIDMVMLADRNYAIPKHRSMLAFIEWVNTLYFNSPELRYVPESYDCENYTRTFAVLADLGGVSVKGQHSIFRIYVEQKVAWGGVPSGGYHALVLFKSDRGWFVLEPQTGDVITLDRYPNKQYIYLITGD
jgi:hypothetical protein